MFSLSFVRSTEEEKGSDCIPQFRGMQECFQKYPEVYGRYTDDDDEENEEEEGGSGGEDTELASQESASTVDSSSEPTTQQSSLTETS